MRGCDSLTTTRYACGRSWFVPVPALKNVIGDTLAVPAVKLSTARSFVVETRWQALETCLPGPFVGVGHLGVCSWQPWGSPTLQNIVAVNGCWDFKHFGSAGAILVSRHGKALLVPEEY